LLFFLKGEQRMHYAAYPYTRHHTDADSDTVEESITQTGFTGRSECLQVFHENAESNQEGGDVPVPSGGKADAGQQAEHQIGSHMRNLVEQRENGGGPHAGCQRKVPDNDERKKKAAQQQELLNTWAAVEPNGLFHRRSPCRQAVVSQKGTWLLYPVFF